MTRRRLILFGLLILLAAALAWWRWAGERPITNHPPRGTTIVAFGDSLVAGVGEPSGEGFVDDLAQRLGVPIINAGRAGDTTADARRRLDEVLAHEPDIVLVLLGGNDVLRDVPREKTRRHLAVIIERLHEAGAVVVQLGVPNALFGGNDLYELLAAEYGTLYVPNILSGVLGRPALMHDHVHPNGRGYEKIAERLAPVLEQLLAAADPQRATSAHQREAIGYDHD